MLEETVNFLQTTSVSDRIAFGALLISAFSLIYAYRSARTAEKGHRLAEQLHQESKTIDRLARQNQTLLMASNKTDCLDYSFTYAVAELKKRNSTLASAASGLH